MTIPGRFRFGDARMNMLVICVSYLIFAVSLLFQPKRWSSTPAYHNLLIIMPAREWGGCFTVISVLLAAAIIRYQDRWLSVLALSAALGITLTWACAFVVRWLTSGNTTPETWVSWFVFAIILFQSLFHLSYKEVKVPLRPRRETSTESDDG